MGHPPLGVVEEFVVAHQFGVNVALCIAGVAVAIADAIRSGELSGLGKAGLGIGLFGCWLLHLG